MIRCVHRVRALTLGAAALVGFLACGDDAPRRAGETDAAFTSHALGLAVSFRDRTETRDGDGVASRLWTFGDGTTSTDESPEHLYAADGAYSVTLAVTDAQGATDLEEALVRVAAPRGTPSCANGNPVAGRFPTSAPSLPALSKNGCWAGEVTTRFGAAKTWSTFTAAAGDITSAVVEVNEPVVIDATTPILVRGIHVTGAGALVVGDTNAEIRARYILVEKGGRIDVGSEACAYEKKLTITLYGGPSDPDVTGDSTLGFGQGQESMLSFGNKVLAIGNQGTLEVHGAKGTPSWTRLGASAKAGAQKVAVLAAPGWSVGDEIVIGTTDFAPEHSERRTITAVAEQNGLTEVSFGGSLEFDHHGEKDQASGVDMSGAVALLTRSIVIKSDLTGEGADYGGQTQYRFGSTVHIDAVELAELGQPGKVGRYPAHFHLMVDASKSYIRRSSVHDSFNRMYVLHGVTKLRMQDNVGYRGYGHGFFLEDGVETENHLDRNLAILPMPMFYDTYWNPKKFKPTNDSETCNPTGFWISNARNRMTNNMAVGGGVAARGFWFVNARSHELAGHSMHVDALSNAPYSDGQYAPILEFANNTATGFYFGIDSSNPGGRVNECRQGLPPGIVTDVSYEENAEIDTTKLVIGHSNPDPRDDGTFNGKPVVSIVDGMTTIRNRSWGAWLRDKWFWLKNSQAVDNMESGMTLVSAGDETGSQKGYWAAITDSVFVGFSSNRSLDRGSRDDYAIPGGYNKKTFTFMPAGKWPKERRGLNFYDGPASVHDSCFYNFGRYDDLYPGGNAEPDDPNRPPAEGFLKHAAIGWFGPGNNFQFSALQETGGLFFNDRVSIRHWVYPVGEYSELKDGDKQTFIKDVDGTLQGVVGSGSINNYKLHRGPVWQEECGSRQSCMTSPYEYANLGIVSGGELVTLQGDAYLKVGPQLCLAKTFDESVASIGANAFCLKGFGTTGDPKRPEIPVLYQHGILALLDATYTAQFFNLVDKKDPNSKADYTTPTAPPHQMHLRLANAPEGQESRVSFCYPKGLDSADLKVYVSGQDLSVDHALIPTWNDELAGKVLGLVEGQSVKVRVPETEKRKSPGFVEATLNAGNLVLRLVQDEPRSVECFPQGTCIPDAAHPGQCTVAPDVAKYTSMCKDADCSGVCRRFGNHFNVCPEGGCVTARLVCDGPTCQGNDLSPACSTDAAWPKSIYGKSICAVEMHHASAGGETCSAACNGKEGPSDATAQCEPLACTP